jgi:transcriptional regulator with XRE-family HTH domain
MTKNERFKKALDWLYSEGLVVDQQELSSKTGINEATISRILNNKVRQPSPETIRKLVSKFRDIDPAYLRGESESVTVQQSPSAQQPQTYIDPASEHNAAISAYVQLANRLTDDLKRKEQEMAERLAEKDARIAELKETLAAKEEIIKARDARIKDLERKIAEFAMNDLSRLPFPFGAADDAENPNVSPNY